MANSYASSPVTASQVGSYFVQQYYQVLQQQPEFVHQFYADSSTVVRVDGESTETASAIFYTLYKSIHLFNRYILVPIEIKTINSLESWNQGIVVVVSGSVRSKLFNGWRKFVQTFSLHHKKKGYFVMNDVFHFVSDEVTHHHPALWPPRPKLILNPLVLLPLTGEDTLEVETRENFNMINIEGNNEEDYYNSHEPQHLQQEDYESESYEEQPPLEEHVQHSVDYVQQEQPIHHQNTVDEYVQEPVHHNTVEYAQEPVSVVEEPVAEPVKFTYASILRSKGKSSPSVPAQPPVNKSVTPVSDWSQTPEPVAQPPPASYVPESTTQVPQESYTNEEGDSKSVYVRNLPTTVTSLEIFQEFKNFGKIKQDGVFLKNRKDVGVCFAFVEFEDLEGVQKAIEASPIQLAGRQVYIEERRANSSGASRGGRGRGSAGGRGRGDASRGRYGGGSYARGNGFR
ncbi:putative Ras GTPase-activating protein-binding protein [Helianthus annuus]|nr:putative Ras GTPase-activating protein-binding protein [Helianthus annuus]